MFKIIPFLLLFTFNACSFDWPISSPEQQGMNSEGINQAHQLIQSGDYGDIRSLIIIKNGHLVSEQYFNNSGDKAPVYSVTKSVGSMLLGIAKFQGAELDTGNSMMNYMPEYANIFDFRNKNKITIKDLLTQRHGLNWDELTIPYETPNNPITIMLNTVDWYRTVLEWQISHLPNQSFAYSTGASSLMSVVLKNITNKSPFEYARTHLFQPLDIQFQDTHWEIIGGLGTIGQGISSFPNNLEPLGFGLWLKPIDMAKLGELYLNKGVWQGLRLLDESWIDDSTFPFSNGVTDPDFFADRNSGYGYQWWTTIFKDTSNRTFNTYYADGYGRQYIFVFPESQMVVVSTARDFNYSGAGIGKLLREKLLPALNAGAQGHFQIDKKLNGSWYWPENSGQGVNIEVLENRNEVLAYWYTYEQDTGKQRWFIMQGEIVNDKAQLIIYSTSGGSFVISESPEVIEWGTGELFFEDCQSGTFVFSSSVENVSTEIPLNRLTGVENCQEPSNKKINKLGHVN
jgi:CubicO group peptidase (beta-lactamase class C family)